MDIKRGYIIDLDGTLLNGNRAYLGAYELIETLKQANIPFLIMTNSVQSPDTIVKRLAENDIIVQATHVLNPIIAINTFLKEKHFTKPWIIGSDSEKSQMPYRSETLAPDSIVLLDFEEINVNYQCLNEIMLMMRKGIPTVTASGSTFYERRGEFRIDTGAFVKLLEASSGYDVEVVGKPSASYFEMGLVQLGCDSTGVTIIGDDVKTDILGASKISARPILVKTGKYKEGDENIFSNCECFESLLEFAQRGLRG